MTLPAALCVATYPTVVVALLGNDRSTLMKPMFGVASGSTVAMRKDGRPHTATVTVRHRHTFRSTGKACSKRYTNTILCVGVVLR